MCRGRCFTCAGLIFLAFAASAAGGAVRGHGHGGSIPARAPFKRSGRFQSDAVVMGSGVVASGNAVTVILKGLQHDWSGDLIATVTYIDPSGNTSKSANLFYRIGQTSSKPDGSWGGFGAAGPIGDNYFFNSDFGASIWSVAAGLGFADVIPGQQTDPVNHGRYFTSDASGAKNDFSYAFAGLQLRGTWRLTIKDVSDHSSQGVNISNTGSLVGWEILIQTAE